MLGSYEREQIENWAGDFVLSDRSATLSPQQRDAAPHVLIQFLIGACEARGVLPHEIEESDVRAGLLGTVAGLKLPAVVAPVVPEIVAGFLTMLEEEGRLSDGRRLAAFARALGPGFAAAASPKSKPIVNPGSPLGRNDPCPCGSGRKFKKCCMRG